MARESRATPPIHGPQAKVGDEARQCKAGLFIQHVSAEKATQSGSHKTFSHDERADSILKKDFQQSSKHTIKNESSR